MHAPQRHRSRRCTWPQRTTAGHISSGRVEISVLSRRSRDDGTIFHVENFGTLRFQPLYERVMKGDVENRDRDSHVFPYQDFGFRGTVSGCAVSVLGAGATRMYNISDLDATSRYSVPDFHSSVSQCSYEAKEREGGLKIKKFFEELHQLVI
ncbi:hypothetical protein GQ43DRAFT_167277 [Delitschia confertaspora ATCC 74209]|uniref:Uncharacterized protein n=1 Tax=Delitschia confertaspora ATCC 74209 TaxID=1513339 RepID=A0A9P4MSP8_9PLEO|nr:hypothetical protein GQ43DRAFT_167277 [Delitschia confertaspora ATCC 74209]